jgi:hypothetical protein
LLARQVESWAAQSFPWSRSSRWATGKRRPGATKSHLRALFGTVAYVGKCLKIRTSALRGVLRGARWLALRQPIAYPQ